jgi:DNA-binding NarL/FixJ family response regulator
LRTTSPTLIAAGPWQDAEFSGVRAELGADQPWSTAPTLRAAIDHIAAADDPPELLLLAQSHPGADDQAEVERLRQLAPLTRVIVVAGSWCEGELRTGRPLTGVVRIYWYEFVAWWRAALERIANRETPPWAEPLTDLRAGHSIRLRPPSTESPSNAGAEKRVLAIDTTDYSTFDALSAGLTPLDWQCVWQPRHRPAWNDQSSAEPQSPTAALWDGGQLDAEELTNLTAFCRRLNDLHAPVVALLDFPRAEHVNQTQSAGAAALFAKPYQLALLHHELTRIASREKD